MKERQPFHNPWQWCNNSTKDLRTSITINQYSHSKMFSSSQYTFDKIQTSDDNMLTSLDEKTDSRKSDALSVNSVLFFIWVSPPFIIAIWPFVIVIKALLWTLNKTNSIDYYYYCKLSWLNLSWKYSTTCTTIFIFLSHKDMKDITFNFICK